MVRDDGPDLGHERTLNSLLAVASYSPSTLHATQKVRPENKQRPGSRPSRSPTIALDPLYPDRWRAEQMTIGDRVRFKHPVDRFPHFVVPAGATGEVVTLDEGIAEIRVDDPPEGMEEWENKMQWYGSYGDVLQQLEEDVELI